MYYNDPNRRDDGTFNILHGTYANNWEQARRNHTGVDQGQLTHLNGIAL